MTMAPYGFATCSPIQASAISADLDSRESGYLARSLHDRLASRDNPVMPPATAVATEQGCARDARRRRSCRGVAAVERMAWDRQCPKRDSAGLGPRLGFGNPSGEQGGR